MHTLFPHITQASTLAVQHLGNVRRSAGANSAAQSLGSIGLILLAILVVFFAMMARAARGMADLIAGFLRLAASMTSGVVLLVIVLIAVVLLAHP
jgi:hypothetical protein